LIPPFSALHYIIIQVRIGDTGGSIIIIILCRAEDGGIKWGSELGGKGESLEESVPVNY
jgi:hypothetical protein